ncbi:MAG TPA: hypothetical protein VFB04_10770 [Terriglobales bacterium]|nr:hypothetical protein [Terriglobales bacterium]
MDRDAVDRRVVGLKNIKPHGRTALYAAIERSLQLFGEPRPGDTVVIVSNGANTLPPVSGNSLANELIARGIRSFALLMAARGIQQTADEQGLEDMSELTRSTGGNVWIISHLDHSGNVNSSASAMIDIFSVELQPPYLLSFHPPMPISKSAKLKVSTGTKELHLEYPQRLTACLPTAATSHR